MKRLVIGLISLILFVFSVLPVTAIGEEENASPLEGLCVLFISGWEGKILEVDTGDTAVLFEGIMTLQSTRDGANVHLAGPLDYQNVDAGFALVTNNNTRVDVEGIYLGSQINQSGDIVFSVKPDEYTPPTIGVVPYNTETVINLVYGLLPTWGPNGEIAYSDSTGLHILTGETRVTVAEEGYSASWSPDGRFLAYSTFDGAIRVFDLESNEPVATDWDDELEAYEPVWVDDETILMTLYPSRDASNSGLYLWEPFSDSEVELVYSEDDVDVFSPSPVSCWRDVSPQPSPVS